VPDRSVERRKQLQHSGMHSYGSSTVPRTQESVLCTPPSRELTGTQTGASRVRRPKRYNHNLVADCLMLFLDVKVERLGKTKHVRIKRVKCLALFLVASKENETFVGLVSLGHKMRISRTFSRLSSSSSTFHTSCVYLPIFRGHQNEWLSDSSEVVQGIARNGISRS